MLGMIDERLTDALQPTNAIERGRSPQLLQVLLQVGLSSSFPFRILIASRPERVFRPNPHPGRTV
jgi:hypothetical protein